MFELRPYQKEGIQAVLDAETRGIRRQLVVWPTGGGKTVLFSELLKVRPNSIPALVLAHREELLEQAKEKIEYTNPSLRVGIEQGPRTAGEIDVVVGSVPSLGRSGSGRLEKYPRDYFRVVIVDEAHHCGPESTSYQRVLDYFEGANTLRLGVTATPQRGDNLRLTDTFDEVVHYKSIEDLIVEGYLCNLRGYRVETKADISEVGTSHGDYVESQLAKVIDTPERNQLVVDAWRKLAQGRKTLVFASTVQHGRNLESAFAAAGISVGSVFGVSSSEDRHDVLDAFRRPSGSYNSLQVLVNCGVLTEGFDYPGIESILLARPTRSTLLYTQIVGRGTRLSPGKDHCLIVDFADITRSKKPHGLPSLLGLPPDFDLGGDDLVGAAQAFRKLEERAPSEAARVRSLEDIELVYSQIDLFRPPPASAAVAEFSNLIWADVGENNYWLGINQSESIHITRDPLGNYHCLLRSKKDPSLAQELGITADLRSAFAGSDRWVIKNRAEALTLLSADAVWRSGEVTEKQAKWLRKYGVVITADMTKGEASAILNKLFETKGPRKPRPAWLEKKIADQKKKGFF